LVAYARIAVEIYREFRFEAAHRLPQVPAGHRCSRLHGHSYKIRVHVRGKVDARTGWVIDFADIEHAFAPLMSVLDHHLLNEVDGLENPTAENIALWTWRRLVAVLPGLCKVAVFETDVEVCEYHGEDEA
jgi:6-pyruvoyltetrahydropterin/6-carboxytetrahydropterin synthase